MTARGRLFAVYRRYAWCSAQQRFGCDRTTGNQIYDGGLWAASLQQPRGATVTGVIMASADTALDGTPIRLVQRARYHASDLGSGRAPDANDALWTEGPACRVRSITAYV